MMYARIFQIWSVPAGYEELVKEKNNSQNRRNILMNNNCVLRQENTT